MGLLDEIRSERRLMLARREARQGPAGGSLPADLSQVGALRWSNAPRRRGDEFLKAYGLMPWLRTTVGRAATATAAVPIRLMRGDEEITEHPVLELLRKPNRRWSGMWLRYLQDVHMWLRGEAFWVIERNSLRVAGAPGGLPAEIVPIPPSWVEQAPPLRDRPFRIRWYGALREIEPDRMIWFSEPDPAQPYGRGLGPAEAIGDELDADEYAARWNKLVFFNKGMPEVLVGLEGANREDLEEFRRDWMEKFGGWWNARRPGFVNTKISVERMTDSVLDMDFVNLRKFSRDVVISVIGTPPEVAGVLQNSNRATIESAEYFMAKYLTHPRSLFHAGDLNMQLLPLFPGTEGMAFVPESPVPEDKEYNLRIADFGARGAWMQVDEARAKVGLDPLPDGDGKVFLLGAAIFPTKKLGGGEEEEPEPGPEPEPAPAPGPEEEPLLPAPGMALRGAAETADRLLPLGPEFESMWRVLRPRYAATVQAFGQRALDEAKEAKDGRGGRQLDEFLFSEAVDAFLAATAGDRIRDQFLKSILADLRAELRAGFAAGEGVVQLAERIADLYDEYRGYKAERVARTEIGRAASWASEEGYRQAEVPFKEWIDSRDDRVRESHQIDGQVVAVGDLFTLNSGVRTPGPGQSGDPAEDIMCRCAVAPTYEPESGRTAAQREAAWRFHEAHTRGYRRAMRAALHKELRAQERRVSGRLRELLS